ncbi:MAG: hypothetical protein WCK61_02625, partial [Candidatus Omnitrophota bacterium]
GCCSSSRIDFKMPLLVFSTKTSRGILLVLLRVTVETEPLPRATQVSTARWLGRQDPLRQDPGGGISGN